MNKLNIVILTYNTKEITKKCLESIFASGNRVDFKVWVLDNGTDNTSDVFKSIFPKVKFLKSEKNLGFVKGNNMLIEKAYKTSEYTLLLNSDTVLNPNSLEVLYKFAEKENFDILTCKLNSLDGSFQPNAGDLPTPIPLFLWLSQLDGVFGRFLKNIKTYHQTKRSYYKDGKQVGWVSGAVMLVKRQVFEKIGFLDNKIFAYCEDADFCWRAKRAGFKLGWTDKTEVIHLGGASSKEAKITQWKGEFKGLVYLYKKYYGSLAGSVLRIFIYFFSFLRIIAFFMAGKPEYSKAYAKIIVSL